MKPKESFIEFLTYLIPGFKKIGICSYKKCDCGNGTVWGRKDPDTGQIRPLKEYRTLKNTHGELTYEDTGKFILECETCREPKYDKEHKMIQRLKEERMKEHAEERKKAGCYGGKIYSKEAVKVKSNLFGGE